MLLLFIGDDLSFKKKKNWGDLGKKKTEKEKKCI
jgi:hypothetical protein